MIKFNKTDGMIEPFTIVLANRNQDHLGEIKNTEAVNFTGNFNAADELSFNVHKIMDGQEERLWDDIYDLRLVYIVELNEYFEISVSFVDQTHLIKTITGKSLCEAELSQTMLYNIEINTEIDIERDDYKVAKFWTNVTDPESAEYKSTILYRVLEKVPAYTVKYVDETLVDLQRVFSINNKSVYDWLISDCATEFNCLVKFDSTDRTISFYDLYTTCPVCHARGMFNDRCTHIITEEDIQKYGINGEMPNGISAGFECGNTDLHYYGKDTTILVSTENLTDEIHYETDVDSIKNSFKLEAGDDDMTAAIVNINPNGSQYIYNYSPESLKDMPEILVSTIQEYNALYDRYKYNEKFIPENTSAYNDLVETYRDAYYHAHNNETELKPLPSPIVGYAKLMEAIYQCFDFYSYLESSMMPKLDLPNPSAETEAEKINLGMDNMIVLSTFSKSTTEATVVTNLLNYAKALVYTGFVTVTVDESLRNSSSEYGYKYNGQSSTWKGRFVVTNNSLDDTDREKTAVTNIFTITVVGSETSETTYNKFIEQKIKKKIAKDEEQGLELTSLLMDKDIDNFKANLKKYSLNRLRSFKDSLDAVLGVMQEANIALDPRSECLNCHYKMILSRGETECPKCHSIRIKKPKQTSSLKIEAYTEFYQPFLEKYKACEDEFNLRSIELETIAKYEGGVMTSGIMYWLLDKKEEINDILDFKKYLDTLTEDYNQQFYINESSPFYMKESGRFVTYAGRGFNKTNVGIAYVGTCYFNSWTYPFLISLDPEAVKYTTTAGGSFSTRGNVEFNGKTWYYAGGSYAFSGNYTPEPANRRFVPTTNTWDSVIVEILSSILPMNSDDYIDFYKLLTTYTRQDTYSNSNYISTSLNNEDLFLMAQMFYDAAYEELLKSSTYQHTITANLYNLLAMDEFKPLQSKFELGNWLRLATDDKLYRLRLISYSVNFDDPTHLDTQFSDVTQTGDGYNDLQSLLNQAQSISTTYPAITKQAELGKLAHTGLDQWLKTGLNSAKTRIMNNDTEEIDITNVGITAKTFNDITETYDDEQLRITHNILAFTDDNWETVSTALGKFTFTHHVPHLVSREEIKEEEAYGLVAEAVLAGWVVSSTVEGSTFIGGHIQNPSNTTYISLTDGVWDERGGTSYPYFINANNKFIVTRDGNIKTQGGHFSNPTDTIYVDVHDYDASSQDITMHKQYFLYCKDPSIFSVTKNGYLTSTSGQIGGFYIGNDYISSYVQLDNNSDDSVTLCSGTFARDMYRVNSVINETTQQVSYEDKTINTTDLKFAIGSNFGVDLSGHVYAKEFAAQSIVSVNTYGENAHYNYLEGKTGKIGHYSFSNDSFSWNSGIFNPSLFRLANSTKCLNFDDHGIVAVSKQSVGDHEFILAINPNFNTITGGTSEAGQSVPRVNIHLNKDGNGNSVAAIYRADSTHTTGSSVIWSDEFPNYFASQVQRVTTDPGVNSGLAEGVICLVYEP